MLLVCIGQCEELANEAAVALHHQDVLRKVDVVHGAHQVGSVQPPCKREESNQPDDVGG
jgi:hypothetical protein